MKEYKVLGVSAGQGALLYPFKKHLIANVEPRSVFHTPKEEQWKLNFGKIPFLKEGLNSKWNPDIILSSPDCGASSIMRLSKVKQLGKPEENKSLNLVLEAVNLYQPKVFLIENLPKLIDLMPQDFFEEACPGYKFHFHCHSVMDFGNSQASRKRLVIVGVKENYKKLFNELSKTFQVDTPKFSKELLEDDYFKGNNTNYMPPLNKTLAMYDYRLLPKKINLTVGEIKKLWVKDFKLERKWPIKTKKMHTLPGVYRLDPDRYPMTLRPADRQFRPDGYPIGIEDYKNIMGFPEGYKVYMNKSEYTYWLGKARYTLAKGSVYQVGIWFKKCFKKGFSD